MSGHQSITILRGFNNHFIEFIEAIRDYFSEDKDVEATIVALQTMKKMNPKLIIKAWKSYIVDKYYKEIKEGSIDFFINKEYSNDIKDLENNGAVLDKINKLREPIKQMQKQDQDKCMKYIQNLTQLTDLYFTN
jgi:hypothetical protein